MDMYFKEDDIIAYIDNDAVFTIPVIERSIMVDGNLVVKGYNKHPPARRFKQFTPFEEMTRFALGLPLLADFMSFFPTFFFPRTVRNCRNFIMMKHNVTDFEDFFGG